MTTATAGTETSLAIVPSCSPAYISLAKYATTGLVRAPLNQIQRITNVCSPCHRNGKFGNFAELKQRPRRRQRERHLKT